MKHPKIVRPNAGRSAFSRRLRRRLRLAISTRPTLYSIYARAEKLRFQITPETTVVVDSYPRSANSFFEAAFTRAHGGRERVAHHSHAAAQVLAGVRLGLPCVVLLREPEAAIASFFEMNGGDYPIDLCTLEYAVFYETLTSVANCIVVVETDELENQFYNLMVLLKDDWGLNLEPYHIDTDVRGELMTAVDETGQTRNGFSAEKYSDKRPVAERAQRAALLATIRAAISEPKNARLLARAHRAHESIRSHAFSQNT
jgi:hypothetical protein